MIFGCVDAQRCPVVSVAIFNATNAKLLAGKILSVVGVLALRILSVADERYKFENLVGNPT